MLLLYIAEGSRASVNVHETRPSYQSYHSDKVSRNLYSVSVDQRDSMSRCLTILARGRKGLLAAAVQTNLSKLNRRSQV